MKCNFWKKATVTTLAIVILIVSIVTVSAIDLPVDQFVPDVTDPNVKSGICGVKSELTWSFNTKTGVLIIFGNGEMKNRTADQTVPWKKYLADIKTIVVLPGVTAVGDYAFNSCTSATSVIYCGTSEQWGGVKKGENYLPASVKAVGLHSFADGECTICGYVCEHETVNNNTCAVCGMTVKKVMLGDVDGDDQVTNADVLEIYRYIYNPVLYPLDVSVGDVDKDGLVTNQDVLLIFRYIYNPVLYPLE